MCYKNENIPFYEYATYRASSERPIEPAARATISSKKGGGIGSLALLIIGKPAVCLAVPSSALYRGNRTEIFVPLPSSLESEICAL